VPDGNGHTRTVTSAREEIEIAGVTIPRGALVYGALASANRDETQFECRSATGGPKGQELAARDDAAWLPKRPCITYAPTSRSTCRNP